LDLPKEEPTEPVVKWTWRKDLITRQKVRRLWRIQPNQPVVKWTQRERRKEEMPPAIKNLSKSKEVDQSGPLTKHMSY
jgi:hypothetical protein